MAAAFRQPASRNNALALEDNRPNPIAQRKPNTTGPKNFVMQLMRNRKRWSPAQREQSRKFWEKKNAKDKRKADSAFMRDEVRKVDQETSHGELALKISGDFPLQQTITSVLLQGSTIAGRHQDVICGLASGHYLRFSRNNAFDTAQYGADVGRMPLIQTYHPHRGATVRTALTAFRSAHDAMRRYEQGDCQSFADSLIYHLTGQHTGFGGDDLGW